MLNETALKAAAIAMFNSPAFQPARGPWEGSGRASESLVLKGMRVAITAYLDNLPSEPVACWRYRSPWIMPKQGNAPKRTGFGPWRYTHDVSTKTVRQSAGDEVQILFTHPPRISDEAVERRRFKLGDRVTKTKGSSWSGHVVGFYSTDLTPIGYAVESENETGSVQIYPEAALAAFADGRE